MMCFVVYLFRAGTVFAKDTGQKEIDQHRACAGRKCRIGASMGRVYGGWTKDTVQHTRQTSHSASTATEEGPDLHSAWWTQIVDECIQRYGSH